MAASSARLSFDDEFLVIGHRGAAGLAPENTLPSFERALGCGVSAVELDIHVIGDALVVIHDDTVDRTTDGSGAVAQFTLDALRRLDAGAGAYIPLLEEVLSLIPSGTGINIELKGVGTGPALASFLPDNPTHDLLISSFDHAELQAFHQRRPTFRTGALFGRWRRDWAQAAEALGAWSVNVHHKALNLTRITAIHQTHRRCLAYTVNTLERATQLANWGLDGLFTDYPDRITARALANPAPAPDRTSDR